jgi:ATP-dependent DNA helicase RecQ
VSFRAKRSAAEEPPYFARSAPATPVAQTHQRPQEPRPAPAESLTPTQQALDQRLRDWRTSEAERLGLPQFFVLGSSALRNIVLTHPRTLTELRSIEGLTLDKAERFGAAIIELCGA